MTYSLVNQKHVDSNLDRLERLKERLLDAGYLADIPNALTRSMSCTRKAVKILKYAQLAEQLEGRNFEEVVEACVAKLSRL